VDGFRKAKNLKLEIEYGEFCGLKKCLVSGNGCRQNLSQLSCLARRLGNVLEPNAWD
jgi:hypothetical protein